MKLTTYLSIAFGLLMTNIARAELIVLAAPRTGDPYYANVADKIFNFHIAYARQIEGRDDMLILTDKGAYDRYVKELGPDKVALAPMSDIWMRDFGTSNATAPLMFRYTAAGQGGGRRGQWDADALQEELAAYAEQAALSFKESNLLNDGGNFVDDYAGNAVISRKFLRDNKLSEQAARDKLRKLAGVHHVAFIESDEQGGLEHADGVVSFVDTNTLIINSYPSDPEYMQDLKKDLRRGLPGVKIHEIITPYNGSKIHDSRFGSACGLYTNALVTPRRIYFPQFGIPQDAIALKQVRAATIREVVPVASSDVCFMGGGVRCMSWQLRGDNASRLKAFHRSTQKKSRK
ncbi:MAG: agmatine deiminase family protein [bacterium]|nr:agmatine deiminase family protein [bacterium]